MQPVGVLRMSWETGSVGCTARTPATSLTFSPRTSAALDLPHAGRPLHEHRLGRLCIIPTVTPKRVELTTQDRIRLDVPYDQLHAL